MFLEIKNIQKTYNGQAVLKDVSFDLPAYGTMSILGKSGCGKSTLLKIIAGLEQADKGTIELQQKDLTHLAPQLRNIVYLFQESLLFPHLSVFENIAFGLRIRKVSPGEVKQKVTAMAELLELTGHFHKMPHQLSGGQKQRVAFGRALILNPPLILLDEPFSSLDVEIRASMQDLYKTVAQQFAITALFVTHDLKEALLMGDSISYMDEGNLQIFNSHHDFIQDSRMGVQNEINFWKGL